MVRSYKKEWMAKNRPVKPSLAPAQKKEVAKIINRKLDLEIEDKHHYTDSETTPIEIDLNGVVFNMTSGLIRGDEVNTFAGASIKPKSLEVRFRLANNKGTTGSAPTDVRFLRVLLLQMKSDKIPLASDVFSATGNFRSTLSFYESNQDTNFRVLVDRTYKLTPAEDSITMFGHIKTNKLSKIYYQRSAPGVVPLHERGGLYLLCMSDSPSGGLPTIEYRSKLLFEDA